MIFLNTPGVVRRKSTAFKINLAFKKSLLAGGFLFGVFLIDPALTLHLATHNDGYEDIQLAAQASASAVVKLAVYDEAEKVTSMGSGFVISEDGEVVSNYHVIQGAKRVEVITDAGKSYPVVGVVRFDVRRDFVVLKIEANGLPHLAIGAAGLLEVGQAVAAMGYPKGHSLTISTGVFSQQKQEGSVLWLEHTAAISAGSSGGPLINAKAEVVGVITAFCAGGKKRFFSIPIDYIKG